MFSELMTICSIPWNCLESVDSYYKLFHNSTNNSGVRTGRTLIASSITLVAVHDTCILYTEVTIISHQYCARCCSRDYCLLLLWESASALIGFLYYNVFFSLLHWKILRRSWPSYREQHMLSLATLAHLFTNGFLIICYEFFL